MSDTIVYTKTETSIFTSLPSEVIFEDIQYTKLEKEETLPIDELENLNVIDPNRYKK